MEQHLHHITPKHRGGTDDPSNLVLLSVTEHANAHLDLYLRYGEVNDWIAFMGLSRMMGKEQCIHEAKVAGGKKGGVYGIRQPREVRVKIGKKLQEWNKNNQGKNTGNRVADTVSLYDQEFIFHQYESITKRRLGPYIRSVVKKKGDTFTSIAEETGLHQSKLVSLAKGKRGVTYGWACSCPI